MNNLIIDQFHKLIEQIKAEYLRAQIENDIKEIEMHSYRLKHMKRVLNIILSLDFEIKNENDLIGIPGIGKGTLKRIKEILETGSISGLNPKYYNPAMMAKINSLREILAVIGVGDRLARKLVLEEGITNVDEFKKAVANKKIRVSRQVLLGLKYYDILKRNIPRTEMKQIEKYLKKKAKEIDSKLDILICGSYRRGRAVSGDIDVMLYHPDVKFVRQIYKLEDLGIKSYLDLFVDLLNKKEFLLDYLSWDKMKYMGFSRAWDNFINPNLALVVRRIDILWMPYNSLPAAMLYFTGPQQLNEEMRLRAKKRNMTLNENGLFIIDSKQNRFAIPIQSEEDIFEELDMKYLTPAEREIYTTTTIKKI